MYASYIYVCVCEVEVMNLKGNMGGFRKGRGKGRNDENIVYSSKEFSKHKINTINVFLWRVCFPCSYPFHLSKYYFYLSIKANNCIWPNCLPLFWVSSWFYACNSLTLCTCLYYHHHSNIIISHLDYYHNLLINLYLLALFHFIVTIKVIMILWKHIPIIPPLLFSHLKIFKCL